jgi:hypothetical protein
MIYWADSPLATGQDPSRYQLVRKLVTRGSLPPGVLLGLSGA